MKKYRHIIWDWNGTLMNDVWLCVEVINSILQERTLPTLKEEDYKNRFQFPVVRYYESLGFDVNTDSFETISHLFVNQYDERRYECALHPEVEAVMQQVQQTGISQSILSAYSQNKLHDVIEHYRLTSYLDDVVGIDNIYAAGKLEQGKALMQRLDFQPGEVVLIGDTLHDYEVAQAIGANCILVSHGHNSDERLLTCSVPVIRTLSELRRWL